VISPSCPLSGVRRALISGGFLIPTHTAAPFFCLPFVPLCAPLSSSPPTTKLTPLPQHFSTRPKARFHLDRLGPRSAAVPVSSQGRGSSFFPLAFSLIHPSASFNKSSAMCIFVHPPSLCSPPIPAPFLNVLEVRDPSFLQFKGMYGPQFDPFTILSREYF